MKEEYFLEKVGREEVVEWQDLLISASPWPVAIAIRLAQTFIEKQQGFSSQKAEVCYSVGQKHISSPQHENPE